MRSFEVTTDIHLSVYQVLNYYRGINTHVDVKYFNDKNISLPYQALLPFMGYEGIHGTFVLKLLITGELEDGTSIVKLLDIKKLVDPENIEKITKKI